MSETIYATFPNVPMTERAVGALLDHGAPVRCISVLADEKVVKEARSPLHQGPFDEAQYGITTTTGGDAAAGAVKGAGIGLGLGAVAAVASLIIPGFGLVIGGGALSLALGAAAATTAAGAIAGGVAGYLIDQGVPDKVAVTYEEELAAGRTLLAVSVPCGHLDRPMLVLLLDKYGAANIGTFPQAGQGLTEVGADRAATQVEQPIPMDVVNQVPIAPHQPIEEMSRRAAFVQNFEDNYRLRGFTYSEVAPAYEFGFLRGRDPRFAKRDWALAEGELDGEWELLHPGTFDTMSKAIRFGWERSRTRPVTGLRGR